MMNGSKSHRPPINLPPSSTALRRTVRLVTPSFTAASSLLIKS